MTHDEYVAKLAALCSEYKYGPVEARKVLEEHEPEVYPDEGLQKWALEYGEMYAAAATMIVSNEEALYVTKKAIEIARDLDHKSSAHMFMLVFTLATLSTGGVHLREMAWAMCAAYEAGVHDQILGNLEEIDNE